MSPTVKYFYKDVNSIFIGSHGGIGTWLSLKRLVKRSKLFFDFYWIVLFSFFCHNCLFKNYPDIVTKFIL